MKTPKLILAALSALTLAGMANAQTTIHITGSTAYRAAAYAAIQSLLQTGFTGAYTGSSLNSANQAIFSGTTVTTVGGGFPVVVKTSWSGSVGGIIVLTKNFTVPNSAQGVTGGWLTNAELPSSGVVGGASSTAIDPAVTADASFSDSFQTSTVYPTPALTGANGYTAGIVGVIPFEWVSGAGNPANITNITSQLGRAALANAATLYQVTGTVADQATSICVFGRDSDSGTRLETFAETGYGILVPPTQFDAIVSGGTITTLESWPAQTTDGTAYPNGHEGYFSGGNLAAALNTPGAQTATNTLNFSPTDMIGYLGISDAASVTPPTSGANCTVCSYNGVPYSMQNVIQGLYTFWGYEHVYYRSGYAGNGQTFMNSLAAALHNTFASTTVSGILVTSMQVGRVVEGGVVTIPNPY